MDDTKKTANGAKTGKNESTKIRYDPNKKTIYSIEMQEDEWEKIKPEPVHWKDRDTQKLKSGWTDWIVAKLWNLYKIPCPFAFKRHFFPVTEGEPYLKFLGKCHECQNPIDGYVTDEPIPGSQIFFNIDTADTSDLKHKTSRHLAGDRRDEEKKKLENVKPKRFEDEEAAEDDLDDTGDRPPYFVTKAVARTARQEVKDSKDGIDKFSRDPVTAILQYMDEEEAILEFFAEPLKVYYWLHNQNTLWNAAAKLNIPISIDASGSLPNRPKIIDEEKSPPLFLYNITIRIGKEVFSICQMLSSKHDAITIARWLEAWIDSGAEIPTQVFVDCSWALLGAICLVFNLCGYFEYLDKCHIYLMEYKIKMKMRKSPTDVVTMENVLPPCRTMRDRAHLIKSICKWKVFSIGLNWTKKDFYVRGIAFCIEIVCTEEMEKVFIALLVLCQSEFRDEGSNSDVQYKYLNDKISTFQHQTFFKKKYDTVEQCSEDDCNFLKEFDVDGNLNFMPSSACDVKSYILDLKKKSQDLLDADKLQGYEKKNTYWLPQITNNLLRLFREYPSWTNVTLNHYPFEPDAVASSTASEIYFRIMKIDYHLVCMSLQRFLLQHLKILKGATRNGRRELEIFKSELDKKKSANREAIVADTNLSTEGIAINTEVIEIDDATKPSIESSYIEQSSKYQTVTYADASKEKIADTDVIDIVDVAEDTKFNYIKTIVAKIRSSRMTYKGKAISDLQYFWEICRIFRINDGERLKYDIWISFFNYNLPYNVKESGCNLTLNAFLSLEQERFLNGEVIDACMSIFKHQSEWQDVFYIPTSQTVFIMGDQCHWNHPPEWIMYNLNFEFFGIVFLPFCYELHWCLVMLDLRNQILYYFDPKYNHTKSRAVKALRQYFKKCKEIHQEIFGDPEINRQYLFQIEWQVSNLDNDRDMKNLPVQIDSHNCGPFIIKYMATLSGINQSIKNFDPDMYRYCIANLLINNFNTDSVMCLLCYNGRNDDVKSCEKCTRWAHSECIKKWKSKLSSGICDICA